MVENKMNKSISLVDIELSRVDWSRLRDVAGFADYVPSVIKALLNAESIEEAEELYWRIDNHVVVQGQLFEAAEYLVPVLMSSLLEINQDFIKYYVFDLLIQIVAGFPDRSEMALGNSEIRERCRAKAREGLWLLYNDLLFGKSEAAAEIIEIIETDASRLETFLKAKLTKVEI